jgi:hypothetical protein
MGILVQHYRRGTDAKSEMAELFASEGDQEMGPTEEYHQSNGNGSNGNGNGNGKGVVRETRDPAMSALFEEFNTLGQDLYGEQWEQVCRRNVKRISGGKTQESGQLTPDQIQQLITGMMKVKSKREPVAVPN